LLDEEFNKLYPVTKYHGTLQMEGTVVAKMTNPNVSSNLYAIDEWCLHDCVLSCRDHQRICPQDGSNLASLGTYERAMREVQAEKLRLGISLERPLLDAKPDLTLIQGGLDVGR